MMVEQPELVLAPFQLCRSNSWSIAHCHSHLISNCSLHYEYLCFPSSILPSYMIRARYSINAYRSRASQIAIDISSSSYISSVTRYARDWNSSLVGWMNQSRFMPSTAIKWCNSLNENNSLILNTLKPKTLKYNQPAQLVNVNRNIEAQASLTDIMGRMNLNGDIQRRKISVSWRLAVTTSCLLC